MKVPPKRLLLINYEFPPLGGGAATATAALAETLSTEGCEVTVLTSRAGREKVESDAGLPYRLIRLWSGRKLADRCSVLEMGAFVMVACLSLLWFATRGKYDGAILYFGLPCGLLGPVLKFGFGVPYVISLRGGDVPGNEPSLNRVHHLLSPVRRFIYRHALRVTANSEGLGRKSEEVDPYPVEVIPNGVSQERYVRHHFPFRSADRVLFVGRLVEQKNVSVLLHAFRNCSVWARLDIVGDGPLRGELENLSTELGIGDRVTFHDWIPRDLLPGFYGQAALLVLPSRYEGMSNVLLEAMAAGLPTITTDVEGTRELVDHGVNGIVVPVGDTEALTREMKRLLSSGRLRGELGRAASDHVKNHFSWVGVARSHLELFEKKR